VLDEPTSALDVTVQQQVLALLQRLQRERGLSYLLITHDVDVIRAMAHEVMVMKDGAVVERGPAAGAAASPASLHPPAGAGRGLIPRSPGLLDIVVSQRRFCQRTFWQDGIVARHCHDPSDPLNHIAPSARRGHDVSHCAGWRWAGRPAGNPLPGLARLRWPLFGWLLLWLARDRFWLLAGAFSGFLIVAPILATGLYHISRAAAGANGRPGRRVLALWRSGDGGWCALACCWAGRHRLGAHLGRV
jgi:hypothetical protein